MYNKCTLKEENGSNATFWSSIVLSSPREEALLCKRQIRFRKNLLFEADEYLPTQQVDAPSYYPVWKHVRYYKNIEIAPNIHDEYKYAAKKAFVFSE